MLHGARQLVQETAQVQKRDGASQVGDVVASLDWWGAEREKLGIHAGVREEGGIERTSLLKTPRDMLQQFTAYGMTQRGQRRIPREKSVVRLGRGTCILYSGHIKKGQIVLPNGRQGNGNLLPVGSCCVGREHSLRSVAQSEQGRAGGHR